MRKYFILISLAISVTGCAYLESYVEDLNIVSIEQERQIGQQVSAEIAKEMVLVNDPALNRKINTIGQRLVQALPSRDFDYHFYIVKDNSPNAFTIPGGTIYVHSGLFNYAEGDSEIAGVLGHEIGHAFQRHPAKSISRAYGVEYLSSLLFKDTATVGKFKTLALQLAKGGLLSHYSRQDEYEADEVGYYLIKQAGYPTGGLLRFLRKLQTLQGSGAPIPFLSSHPPTPDRIARLEALEQGAPVEIPQTVKY